MSDACFKTDPDFGAYVLGLIYLMFFQICDMYFFLKQISLCFCTSSTYDIWKCVSIRSDVIGNSYVEMYQVLPQDTSVS